MVGKLEKHWHEILKDIEENVKKMEKKSIVLKPSSILEESYSYEDSHCEE